MHLAAGPRAQLLPDGHGLFGQCHAATLVRLPSGDTLAAFFAGSGEGAGDTAVWLARRHNGAWLAPRRLLAQPGVPHWNPVLHADGQQVWLFYKTGADVHHWITQVAVSADGGMTWSPPRALVPDDTTPRGPVKNKLIVRADGTWLAPGSLEGDAHWDAFVDRSTDRGKTWHKAAVPLVHMPPPAARTRDVWSGLAANVLWQNDPARTFAWDGVIQPSLWESAPNHLHMLLRSTRGRIYRSDSRDDGQSWTPAYPTRLPNNNSGLDLARLHDGTLVLACNPVAGNWGRRTPLALFSSSDNGESWVRQHDLEDADGEFSYPAMIATAADSLSVAYTADRRNIIYRDITIMP
jgi:predicted neuraminidase